VRIAELQLAINSIDRRRFSLFALAAGRRLSHRFNQPENRRLRADLGEFAPTVEHAESRGFLKRKRKHVLLELFDYSGYPPQPSAYASD